MAEQTVSVKLPKELLIQALNGIIAQRKRAINTSISSYGEDHILTQTLRTEYTNFVAALDELRK